MDRERSASSAALFTRVLREVPGVLDRLSNEDKASLAAARWSTLEAVLRGSDATLKVNPTKPVLHVLARVMEGGECRGEIEYRGVRVPATEAGAFAAALRGAEQERVLVEMVAVWAAFVWRVLEAASTSEEGPLRVTGLIAPSAMCSISEEAPGVALALRTVLEHRAAREHLRHLELPRLQADEAGMLQGGLRGLAALQGLRVTGAIDPNMGDGAALVGLIRECATLRRLTLTHAKMEARDAGALLRWVSGASELRELRLQHCGINFEGTDVRWPSVGAHPLRRLEVYETVESGKSAWATERAWQGLNNLRCVALDWLDLMNAEQARALADLLRRSERLNDVELRASVGSDLNDGVRAVLAGLAQNTSVRRFEMSVWALEGFPSSDLVQGMADVVRSNRTLRDFEVNVFDWDLDAFCDVGPVAEALMANTSLEKLKLPPCGPECDATALGGRLARNQTLRCLAFADLPFFEDDLEVLGRGLAQMASLQSLEVLQASGVEVQDSEPGVLPLLDGLWGRGRMSQLRRLKLHQCQVIDEDAVRLAELLASERCTLRKLDLSCNGFSDSGLQALAGALRVNTTLVSLDVEGNAFTDCGVVAVLQALRRNTTLRVLSLKKYGDSPAVAAELKHLHGCVLS